MDYPEIARDNGIQGKVWVSFIVNTKGEVTEVKLAKGVHRSLNDEAIRVVRMSPDFSPGILKDKPVNVSFTVPVSFKVVILH